MSEDELYPFRILGVRLDPDKRMVVDVEVLGRRVTMTPERLHAMTRELREWFMLAQTAAYEFDEVIEPLVQSWNSDD